MGGLAAGPGGGPVWGAVGERKVRPTVLINVIINAERFWPPDEGEQACHRPGIRDIPDGALDDC